MKRTTIAAAVAGLALGGFVAGAALTLPRADSGALPVPVARAISPQPLAQIDVSAFAVGDVVDRGTDDFAANVPLSGGRTGLVRGPWKRIKLESGLISPQMPDYPGPAVWIR